MRAIPSVAGRTVLIAGATSTAGLAVAASLADAGAQVVAVGSNLKRLQSVRAVAPEASLYECDLTDFDAVKSLAQRVAEAHGPIDGLIHLVGGWRGGGGLAGQTDDDWDFLHSHVVATLRNTTRAFNADLLASPAGRLAIVSSVSVDKPNPGGANYAAAKSAAETWVRAVGQGFAKADAPAVAMIFAVRSLAGLEHDLARQVVALWGEAPVSAHSARAVLEPA